jgi:hypothetical protein
VSKFMGRKRIVAVLSGTLFPIILAIPTAAQTGLPFSGVPQGGMGNAPGIAAPAAARVPVTIAPRSPFRSRRSGFGTGPIFFGSDEPSDTSVIINNIIPSAANEPKKPVVTEEPLLSPLVIERDGDRWVRRRLANVEPGTSRNQTESEPQRLPTRAAEPLPETTLVFRDGHREKVGAYLIFDGALFHSDPAWAPQKKVLLSQLDLGATVSLNRQVGVTFRLPNAPNEVVTRP